ncbi:MAG: leucine-rich repeat domain-containing protein, partial [Oscillospiraceae bacterium]|nr:leucine-rich repeat domain-containing protein [Oscillospiraceae bacterium]
MKKNIVSFLLCFCIAASLLSGMTPSAFAECLPLERKVDAAQPQTDEGESIPAVEDVPLAFPSGEGGSRSETEEVSESLPLEGKVDAAQPQTDEVESLSASPIETAPAEEVTAELQATYSGACGDNLTWELDTTTGMLTISGTGAMTDYDFCGAPWYSYRDSIKSLTINDSVTSIGIMAFCYCSRLVSITLPDSITRIGVWSFAYCTSLTRITLPDSITIIESEAFWQSNYLTRVIYCGTKTQWSKISIAAGNDALKNAARTYHTHEWSIEHEIELPSCTEAGRKIQTCTGCEIKKTIEKISALGHDLVHHEAKTAVCEEIGWSEYDKCTRCNYTTYIAIPAPGHTWDEGVITAEPMCEEVGVKTYTCTHDASHSYTEVIP